VIPRRGQGSIDTPLILSLEPTIPLLTLIDSAVELLKASLNVVVAEEQAFDGPEGLTSEAAAQIGLYAHPCQDGRTPNSGPPLNS
jgi:hypothetical protein